MTTVAQPGSSVSAKESPTGSATPTPAGRWARRLGVIALIAGAPAATLYLSFSNGGYFPNSVGIIALCLCAAFVLRVTLADRPFEGFTRIAAIALLALGLFALLQLVSTTWSHAPSRALDAFDRTLVYLLVLALFASLPRSTLRLTWLVRSLAAVMSVVCLAGLISRTLPHLWPTSPDFFAQRLDYPLGYWNALGLMGSFACVFLLHLSSSLREPRSIRIAAAALTPAVATATLLTYSRGALGVVILGLVVYAVLGRPRGLLTGLIAVVPTSFFALHSGYDAVQLSGINPTSAAAVAEGHHVAIVVGVAVLAAGALRAGGLVLDPRLGEPVRLPINLPHIPRWAAWSAVAVVVVVALIVAGAPGFMTREFHRFTSNQAPSVAQTRDRLTDPASNGRIALWKVAADQFSQYPFAGEGAGTYENYHAQYRTDSDVVVDAHSLYLQTLGEDGIVGLFLLATALGAVVGVLAWRIRGPNRTLYAALFAATIAWAIHNQFDWDWQMPAVTLWLFAVGGLVLADRRPAAPGPISSVNRTALAAGFLAVAIAPLLIGFSYQRLRAAGNAFNAGNCSLARQRALSSMSLLAVRPQAYAIVGYCDLKQSYPVEGLAAMRRALSYDSQNWEYHYGLAIALAADGQNPMAEARRALQLNPREFLAQDEVHAFETAAPGRWAQAWRPVMAEGLGSGGLAVSKL